MRFLRRRLAGLLATLVLLAASAGAEVTLDGGHLLDLGSAPTCEPARGTIVVRNTGDAEVRLQALTTSCGCTTVAPATRDIAAGGTLEIPVALTALAAAGEMLEHVDMQFSDGTLLRVSVKAKFAECFSFPPALPHLDVGSRVAGTSAPAEFRLPFCFRARVPPGSVAVAVGSEDERAATSVRETADHAACATHVEVTVTFRDLGVLGPVNIPLRVEVLGERINGAAIRGRVVSADVEVSDAPLFFGTVRVGRSVQRTLDAVPSRAGVELRGFRAEGAFAVVSDEAGGAGGEAGARRATISCSPEGAGPVHGRVRIAYAVEGEERHVLVPLVATGY